MDLEAANHVPYRQARDIKCYVTEQLATNKARVDLSALGFRGKRTSPGVDEQTLVAPLGSQGLTVLKVEIGELLFQARMTPGMLSAASELEYASVFSSFNGISIDSQYPIIKSSKMRNSNIKNYFYRTYEFTGFAMTSVSFDQQNYRSVHGATQLVTNGLCGKFTGYAFDGPIGFGTLLEWDIPTPNELTDSRFLKFHNKQTGYWKAANYQSFNDHMDNIMGALANKTNGTADPVPYGDYVEIDFQIAFMRMIQEIGKAVVSQKMDAVDFANSIDWDRQSGNFKMNPKMKTLVGALSDPMKKENAVMGWLKFVPELVRDHGSRIRAMAIMGAKRGDDYVALLKP